MNGYQPNIFAPVPLAARSIAFGLRGGANPNECLARISCISALEDCVIGLGEPLTRALNVAVPGLRSFPALTGSGCAFPSTQGALWIQLHGDDRGILLHRSHEMTKALGPAYYMLEDIETFRHKEGRDLTGFEDGTENPTGDGAIEAAIVSTGADGLVGSSFVAVQQWAHDLEHFMSLSQAERDATIGRRLEDNEEMDDAPANAHVKRAAQESYDPPAFMVRRSMPWMRAREQGLLFVAYGESLDRFERVLRRMAGLEDGLVDALLRFSHARTGAYYWCPPIREKKLDLRLLGV